MRVCQFSGKTNSFDFFSANLPKSGFWVGSSENYCRNKNQHSRYIMCANVLSKWKTLNFSVQICRKKYLGFETEKNNVGIIINIVETLCAHFQLNWITLTFLAESCPKMDLGLEIEKTNVGIRISIAKMLCVPIFTKNRQLWLFRPKFAKKWILGSEFQKSKSGFGNSTSKIPCVPIFS